MTGARTKGRTRMPRKRLWTVVARPLGPGQPCRAGMEEVVLVLVLVLERQPVLVLVLEWGIDD